jgi:peptide chain release factor 1
MTAINERDLRIQWYSGTGCGGQYRNKHQNSCRIVHMPTGIQAIGTKNRERSANLRDAMVVLERRVAESKETKKERRNDDAVVRTYHFGRNETIDHATGLRKPVADVLDGDLDAFVMHLNRGARPRHTGRT